MSRKLSLITESLKRFVSSPRFGCKLPIGSHFVLPPVLEIAKRRGEAILVSRFFEFTRSQHVSDPAWELALYEQIVSSGKPLLDICQRIGIFKHFSAPLADTPEQAAFIAWCILTDTLDKEQHPYLENATTDFFRHFFLGHFPKSPVEQKLDLNLLKQRVNRRVLRLWGPDAVIKESFTVSDTEVQFTIKLKTSGSSWLNLWHIIGTRLKPTRVACYTELLEALEDGRCKPETVEATPLVAVVSRKKAFNVSAGKLLP
jgi:hypothetical protein